MKKINLYILILIVLITLMGCKSFNVNQDNTNINQDNTNITQDNTNITQDNTNITQSIELIKINDPIYIELLLHETKKFELNGISHTITFKELDKNHYTENGDYFIFITIDNETKNIEVGKDAIFESKSLQIMQMQGRYIDDIYVVLRISFWQSLSDKYNTLDLTEKDIFNEDFKNSLNLSFKGVIIGDSLETVNKKLDSNIKIPENTNNVFEHRIMSTGITYKFKKGLKDNFELNAIFFKEDANSVLIGDTKIGVAEDMKLELDGFESELSSYEKKKGIRFYFKDGKQEGMTLVMPQ